MKESFESRYRAGRFSDQSLAAEAASPVGECKCFFLPRPGDNARYNQIPAISITPQDKSGNAGLISGSHFSDNSVFLEYCIMSTAVSTMLITASSRYSRKPSRLKAAVAALNAAAQTM